MESLYIVVKNLYDDEINERVNISKAKQFHSTILLGIITFMYYLGTLLPKRWKEVSIQFGKNLEIPICVFIAIIIAFFIYYFIRLLIFLSDASYEYIDSERLSTYYNELNAYYNGINGKNARKKIQQDFEYGAIDVMLLCISHNRNTNLIKKKQAVKLLKSMFSFLITVLIILLIFLVFMN